MTKKGPLQAQKLDSATVSAQCKGMKIRLLDFFRLSDCIDRNRQECIYSNIPNSFSNNIMILNFNFQYSKFLFLTERRWGWVQIVVFDSFVWHLQWCLTVSDCIAVIFNVSPCILLFHHLQMAGRTDGNPNLINYNRNILDQQGLTGKLGTNPWLDGLHADFI